MSRLFLLGVLSGLALAVAITASVLAGLGAGEAAERVLASKPRASELTAIARDAGTRQARAGDAPARASRAAPDRRPSLRSCRRIVIDPGHDARPNLGTEPVGPGARARKTKDGGGPVGVATGREAHAVNLAVSLGLRERLVERGYCVTMTRAAASSRPSRGNVARAGIANKARATLFLRIHVDASPSQARRGSAVLYPAYDRRWTADILPQSKRAARVIQSELGPALGGPDLGSFPRADITGFNWADVPSVLAVVGFLTNPQDDQLLSESTYRRRAVEALTRGVDRFTGGAHKR